MKKIGKILLWLFAIILAFKIVRTLIGYASRRIAPGTVLSIRVEGNIPEQPPQQPLEQLIEGPTQTLTDIVEGLDRAQKDRRITGLAVRVSETTMSMAKLQEVRDKILEFNRTGKFSVAFLEFATNRSYYLASACETVFLLPKSNLYVRGMMASTTFYRGALDKLGIYPDLYRIGDYKNATNVYTEKKYTRAHREADQALLDDWYREFLSGVAKARDLKIEDVVTAVAKGPLTSQEALAVRLVDQLGYPDEARELVRRRNHESRNRIGLREYLRRTDREENSKVAVIYATGLILPGRSGSDPFGESVMGSDTIVEQFRRAREDSSVRAVVLRIDSGGGASFSSEVIRRAVERTKRVKPVVVSMSDVAASGGYWIGMSANKIVAEPGTVTGSIGVFFGKLNLRGLFDKLGLSTDYVTTTENSTFDYPFQNFTPAQRDSVLRTMRDTYQGFLQGVAEGRHLDVKAVDQMARGRVWTGERARGLGLVDELGGLHAAVAAARDLARIPRTEKVSLLYLPPPKSLLEELLQLTSNVKAYSPLVPVRDWIDRLELLSSQPVWTVLPAIPRAR